jgi:molybdopterin-binding protein
MRLGDWRSPCSRLRHRRRGGHGRAGGLAHRALGTDNWLRGAPGERPRRARVDLGGTKVVTQRLDRATGETLVLALPAEDVLLARGEIHGTSARNVFSGTVLSLEDVGAFVDVTIATPAPIRARVTRTAAGELALNRGSRVWLMIKASAFRVAG